MGEQRTESTINPTVCPKCGGDTALISIGDRVWRWQCAECDWGRMEPPRYVGALNPGSGEITLVDRTRGIIVGHTPIPTTTNGETA